jgi:osmotically inducible protein OsmC
MKPEHADNIPMLREARFGEVRGSNPEELIGAALAGCFSMAFAIGLERAGMPPVGIRTDARVRFERVGEAFEIRHIELSSEVRAPDGDETVLNIVAQETLRACPVGKALKAIPVEVNARLVGPKAQPSLGAP